MYSNFSRYYDALTADVDYEKRTEYIMTLFERFDRKPTLLLDLACGTGGFSNAFAALDIDVIGVDVSTDMLSVAGANSSARGLDVLYLCQDARTLDLFGTVDGAVCCLDSLNHIIDYADFCEAIKRVALFLEPGRLFIFDVNTVYKQRRVLGDNTFVLDEDGLYCVWQNSYDSKSRISDIELDFFESENGVYNRTFESFSERAYTKQEIARALKAAGLEELAVYAEQTYNQPVNTTERIVYVSRKKA